MKLKFVPRNDFYSEFALSDDERSKAASYITPDIYGHEIAHSYYEGCLLTRLFTDEIGYYFWPAVPLSRRARLGKAYEAISDYARLEAIKEVYVDLPRDHVSMVTKGKPYATVTKDEDDDFRDDEDEERGEPWERYFVEIDTECTLAEYLPEVMVDDVYLSEFAIAYAADYERLVRNKEVNRYFGYSYLDDAEGASGTDFINMAREQFDRGEAMNFAATVLSGDKNLLIGEGTLYGFDGKRGASFSLRLLPEWQGKGYGKKILAALISLANGLGLFKLYAEIDQRNIPSIRLVSTVGKLEKKKDSRVRFTVNVKRALKKLNIKQ